MKGLVLTAKVAIQVVEANMKAIDLAKPSGNKPQASVTHTATTSSVATPAPATASRCRRCGSFQTSSVSV